MSKIHILKSDGNFGYKVVIHYATSSGNNSVGLSWKSCAIAAEMIQSTILDIGSAPGNITQIEHDSIKSGDTIEIIRTICPGILPTNAAVEALVDIAIAESNADMSAKLKYYGHTIT